jgi:glycosyltransferase involved in cell wall biosynthesis
MKPVLSVVVPMHNEAANVQAFYDRVSAVLDGIGDPWEIVCVDDGSRDATLVALAGLHQRDPRVKVIGLSRNFGKEAALTAGLDHAGGEAVIPIDADLQDPPELIPALVAKWREGFEVVNATRRSRQGETWLKKASANAFYRALGRLTTIDIPRDTGDFRLLSRPAIDALKRLPERNRFMKGLFAWVGFKQAAIEYDREPRHAGRTNWNYWRLWNFALDGITSFSSWPLRIWTYLGVGIAIAAFVYAGVLVVRTLVHGVDVPGYASLMVVLLFVSGVQLIGMGVLGEYLARVFDEVKRRPLYLVGRTWGLPAPGPTPPEP